MEGQKTQEITDNMSKSTPEIIDESGDKYKYGFVTEIDSETVPKGLNGDIIRFISQKKR